MDLEFTRGDTQVLKFQIKDNSGNVLSLSENDKLYFTVKKSATSDEVVMQKTVGKGIELKEDGYYYITIDTEDTAELDYGGYMYDIEIKSGKLVKTLILATLTLTEEVTWKGDEI